MAQNCQKGPKMAHNGPNIANIVWNCLKWCKITNKCHFFTRNLTILVKTRLLEDSRSVLDSEIKGTICILLFCYYYCLKYFRIGGPTCPNFCQHGHVLFVNTDHGTSWLHHWRTQENWCKRVNISTHDEVEAMSTLVVLYITRLRLRNGFQNWFWHMNVILLYWIAHLAKTTLRCVLLVNT